MTKKKKSKKEKKVEMAKNLLEEIKKMQLDDDELGRIQAGGLSKNKKSSSAPKIGCGAMGWVQCNQPSRD
jgi:hypothetical protein